MSKVIWFVRQLVDAKVIFDVGAAKGRVVKALLGVFPDPDVRAYAFEPTPKLCQLTGRRLEVIGAAVLDKAGTVMFNVNTDPHTNSVLPFMVDFSLARTVRTIAVPAVTLDGFCAEREIDGIDILKIDAQGAELLVLRGAQNLLSMGKIKVVVTELQRARVYEGQCQREEVIQFLGGYGLELKKEFPARQAGEITHSDGVFAI